MSFNLHGRHFLAEADFTRDEMLFLIDLAGALKRAKYSGT